MDEIYNQLFSLLFFIITGISIGILFDFFRILRRTFKTIDLVTYIQDILFWIITGGIMLFSIFKFNSGQIRSYVIIGIVFGFFLYKITISKFIVKYCVIIMKWIKTIFYYITIKIIKNIFIDNIINVFKNIKKRIIIIYKTTKNTKKTHKNQTTLK